MRMLLLGLVPALAVACSNEVGGDLTVNGAPFAPTGCRNGVVHGFRGVALSGKDGSNLRIAASMTGEAIVAILPGGARAEAQAGLELGKCGLLTIGDQSSTINDVRNVEGKADLDCSAKGYTLKGTVTFANCH
ncbi:MAG: hypothetical protein R2939_09600 [Kofleriaceae bacterium]